MMDLIEVPLSQVFPGVNYSRDRYVDIPELAASIKARGRLIHPIMVRLDGDGDGRNPRYTVISGFRRYYALCELDPQKIGKVVVQVFYGTDLEAALLNLDENLERRDVSVYDFAKAAKRIGNEFELDLPALAAKLRKSKGHVSNCLALVSKLCPEVRAELDRGLPVPSSKLFLWKTLQPESQKEALSQWKMSTSTQAMKPARGRPKSKVAETLRERARQMARHSDPMVRQTAEYILGATERKPP